VSQNTALLSIPRSLQCAVASVLRIPWHLQMDLLLMLVEPSFPLLVARFRKRLHDRYSNCHLERVVKALPADSSAASDTCAPVRHFCGYSITLQSSLTNDNVTGPCLTLTTTGNCMSAWLSRNSSSFTPCVAQFADTLYFVSNQKTFQFSPFLMHSSAVIHESS